MAYLPFKSQYNAFPTININKTNILKGYNSILQTIESKNARVVVIDCYHGVDYLELEKKHYTTT